MPTGPVTFTFSGDVRGNWLERVESGRLLMKWATARKPGPCAGCGAAIERGQRYWQVSPGFVPATRFCQPRCDPSREFCSEPDLFKSRDPARHPGGGPLHYAQCKGHARTENPPESTESQDHRLP